MKFVDAFLTHIDTTYPNDKYAKFEEPKLDEAEALSSEEKESKALSMLLDDMKSNLQQL